MAENKNNHQFTNGRSNPSASQRRDDYSSPDEDFEELVDDELGYKVEEDDDIDIFDDDENPQRKRQDMQDSGLSPDSAPDR